MDFFIANAYAADAAPGGETMQLLITFLAMGLFFYFLIIRPQTKRAKEHKSLVESLSKGDEVLTQGGLVGRVVKIVEDKEYVTIALNESNEVLVQKTAVLAVLPKGTIKEL
jgi:preprotein translocase subunit YajC